MSARAYTVSFTKIAVTTAVDVFEIAPATNKPVNVVGIFMGQSSDFADAESEILPYRVIRGHTTIGSGGTTQTPRPVGRSDTAAAFTAKTNNTTGASAGTPLDIHVDSFNVMGGEKLWIPEGLQWETSATDGTIVVRLATAPVDSLTLSGTIYLIEQG